MPQYYGVPLDYAQIPQDAAVYKTIQAADTVGLFQIESRAQMSAVAAHEARNAFQSCQMQVAIIRPGPVTGKIRESLHRTQARKAADYLSASVL